MIFMWLLDCSKYMFSCIVNKYAIYYLFNVHRQKTNWKISVHIRPNRIVGILLSVQRNIVDIESKTFYNNEN
jgi:hypothetical protein